jgi:hypothetical protein
VPGRRQKTASGPISRERSSRGALALASGYDAAVVTEPPAGEGGERRTVVPLYMDHHKHVEGLTAEAVADAHAKDLEAQEKYGVNYIKYWFNE